MELNFEDVIGVILAFVFTCTVAYGLYLYVMHMYR
jgi:hypothetical protein